MTDVIVWFGHFQFRHARHGIDRGVELGRDLPSQDLAGLGLPDNKHCHAICANSGFTGGDQVVPVDQHWQRKAALADRAGPDWLAASLRDVARAMGRDQHRSN